MKKDNSLLWILGAVAVAGYFAFRSGGFLNKHTQLMPAAQPSPQPAPAMSNPNDISVDIPTAADVGIYIPTLDPTGNSIQIF